MSDIVRMAKWARVRRNVADQVRSKTSSRCTYCGVNVGPEMVIDHFIAFSVCGHDEVSNLVPCCRSCNCSKRDRTIEGWRFSKRFKLARERHGVPAFTHAQIDWLKSQGFDVFAGVAEVTFWFERHHPSISEGEAA